MLGIDDGHPIANGAGDDGGGGDAAGIDAAPTFADASNFDSALPGAVLPDGAPVAPACDPTVTRPDPANGVFVTTGGTDSPTCSQTAPCATLQHAIQVARDLTPVPNIYVAAGTYTEQVHLQSGITLIGGWDATTWDRLCSQTATTVRAPTGATTTILANFTGTAALSTMQIGSQAAPSVASATLTGISVTGASTIVNLAYVEITMLNGGDGVMGAAGDSGASPPASCEVGDASASSALGGKGIGADAGWFDPNGYESMVGAPGGLGGSGANGGAGDAGACVDCLTCTGTAVCAPGDAGVRCGSPGTPGCGGPGGFGAAGGVSGGSSVALFVWDATVNLTACAFVAGNGGNGGAGGAGGVGAGGSEGSTGAPALACDTVCSTVSLPCGASTSVAAGGGPSGGRGGQGANGGAGGDGAGGDSVAIVQGGGGRVVADAITKQQLVPGQPGVTADGGNGANGAAAAELQP